MNHNTRAAKNEFIAAQNSLQHKSRQLKNEWIPRKAIQIQHFASSQNMNIFIFTNH